MNAPTDVYAADVSGIPVTIHRKAIKHLYIRVDPSDGTVRVSVPARMAESSVRRAIAARAGWIRRQQQRLAYQPEAKEARFVTGETHWAGGRACTLNVVQQRGRGGVALLDGDTLELRVPAGADRSRRRAVLERWYRQALAEEIPALVQKWQPVLGVRVAEWRIKRMKTRWGTCNIRDRRVWMNLALAKRPPECLEYVLVHEMVHLLERRHTARFHAFMDRFLPDWRARRERLEHVHAVCDTC